MKIGSQGAVSPLAEGNPLMRRLIETELDDREARQRVLEDPAGYRDHYLRKYSELEGFADAGETAWCALEVRSYDVVHRFQEVVRIVPGVEP